MYVYTCKYYNAENATKVACLTLCVYYCCHPKTSNTKMRENQKLAHVFIAPSMYFRGAGVQKYGFKTNI